MNGRTRSPVRWVPRRVLSRSLKGGQGFRSGRTRRRIESFSRFVNRSNRVKGKRCAQVERI